MVFSNGVISILLIMFVSALLIFTGLKKQPGIGVIGAVVIIALTLVLRGDNLAVLGFSRPDNWVTTILLGLVLGIIIQLLAVALIEPISERLTHSSHDHSVVAGVKGNWKAFVQWMLIVWILVAFLEEGIYRGFLMTEVAKVVGAGSGGLIFNVLFTSVVFGLSHGYQSRCGILSTGVVGIFLGMIYVLSDFNLWLAIFTHGFIDTVGIGLIAIGADKTIQKKIWKTKR